MNMLNQAWDLDAFFPGGSESPAFAAFLDETEAKIADVTAALQALAQTDADSLKPILLTIQDLDDRVSEAVAFTMCLTNSDTTDKQAKLLNARVAHLSSLQSGARIALNDHIVNLPDDVFAAFLQDEEVEPVRFILEERRRLMAEKMPPEQEVVANDLAVNGYHSFFDLYNSIIGRITVTVDTNGKTETLSLGQASNRMSSPDRAVRQLYFDKIAEALSEYDELFAHALNNMSGFRLSLYRLRGWDSFLKEPLDICRMSEATLNAMWDTIDRNKGLLVKFLDRKAKLLGVEKLAWYDVNAPLGTASSTIAYDEAASFIVEQFDKFSPRFAQFAERAFHERWIEAEDRPGKLPGGFCISFPVKKQTRIFMTFSGTPKNVDTLAHELGHAYHDDVMQDLPSFNRQYAMNVAETASTFAEVIVSDAALKRAATDEERIVLLESKILRTILYLMNVHSAFLYEKRFYELRKQGPLSIEQITSIMTESQQEAFRGALASYSPTMWMNRLHHYLTDVPFYNFPYTFGFLFSTGIYARALAEGSAFESRYVDLLRDTGRMTVEELAQKHLGADLTKPDFWQSAIDLLLADIEEFLRLTA